MRRLPALILLALPALTWAGSKLELGTAPPPTAPIRPYTVRIHGDTLIDNYFWIKDKKDPATIAYIEAENAYTAAVTKPLEPFADKLYQDILRRIKQTDLSVPYQKRGWWYYSKNEEGKQYPIRCRKLGNLDAPEQVILDGNELAKGQKFASVGTFNVSDDGHLLAYSVDTTGFREYMLYVKDLRTGKLVTERPLAKVSNAVWAADNKTLFYVTEDQAKRPHKVWRHVLGEGQATPVYEEKDELYRLGVRRSRDDRLVFIQANSSDTDEAWYVPADKPESAPVGLLPREKGHEFSVDHRNGLFYIVTNKDAKDYRVVTAPVADPSPKNWAEIIPHRPGTYVGGVQVFADFMAVLETEKAVPQVAVYDFKAGGSHRLSFAEPIRSVFPAENPEFNTEKLRFTYQSFITPPSVFEYDMSTRERKLLKRTEVLGGYEPSQYACERIEATAPDGTKVPISLCYKKGTPRDGTAACNLNGYGAYGAPGIVGFNVANLALLDRGVVVALAHIRGGKDLGQHWHDQGKMMQKRNSFTDFIACADHLVNTKICSRDRLVIRGGSAGGLLMGAVVNMRPDVAKAVVLDVPFVDVINTMMDKSLPLTVQEFLEWGNPDVTEEYQYLKSYCPYTNLKPGTYPAMLVTTSLNDSQVLFHEPTKYVAKLRTLKKDKTPLLFKCNMAGGHGGSSGRYDVLKEAAFRFAFMLDQMGIDS